MTTKAEIQELLRFLSRDAKIPLAGAMSKIKPLQEASLNNPTAISQVSMTTLSAIFGSEAAAKPVLLAAKRVSKKRPSNKSEASPASKRLRTSLSPGEEWNAKGRESRLMLPSSEASEDVLAQTTLVTNRAPLVLAFAVAVLERTMPRQPLSSRLSLAQAVVGLNSRSKAQSIGLESGRSAEDEGWGMGTQKVTVLGRQVSAIKRGDSEASESDTAADRDIQVTTTAHEQRDDAEERSEEGLWGLDLEAMRAKSSSAAPIIGAALPIHQPEAARAYLLRSFATAEPSTGGSDASVTKASKKKKTKAEQEAEKEENCGKLLTALHLLYESWEKLAPHELDRRAWSWYVAVRPEVATGVAGWGGKNVVKLKDILDLRREN